MHGVTISPFLAAGVLALAAAQPRVSTSPPPTSARFCTLRPGSTIALLRVEKDPTLPFAPAAVQWMSAAGVAAGPYDSLLATPATPMPAARVRLLQLDSATRAILASQGVTDAQPVAFMRAAPYRADCRTLRWTDTIPFTVAGEVGYVRATLAPRADWIDNTPVLIVPDGWHYPYPRRRWLAVGASPDAQLAPAEAMFSLNATIEVPPGTDSDGWMAAANAQRVRAIAWGRANPAAAELEPARTILRRAVLDADWRAAERMPSRLRGTYRVDLEAGDQRGSWYFRTTDKPAYSYRGADSLQSSADLLASPYIGGYRLVGYTAGAPDGPFISDLRTPPHPPLVWLATNDRPTAPGNDARRVLSGILEFNMAAAPELLWTDLELFVPKQSAMDSVMLARLKRTIPRGDKQPQLPLTLRFDPAGSVHADTTLTLGGRMLRVQLQRIDTVSVERPF